MMGLKSRKSECPIAKPGKVLWKRIKFYISLTYFYVYAIKMVSYL